MESTLTLCPSQRVSKVQTTHEVLRIESEQEYSEKNHYLPQPQHAVAAAETKTDRSGSTEPESQSCPWTIWRRSHWNHEQHPSVLSFFGWVAAFSFFGTLTTALPPHTQAWALKMLLMSNKWLEPVWSLKHEVRTITQHITHSEWMVTQAEEIHQSSASHRSCTNNKVDFYWNTDEILCVKTVCETAIQGQVIIQPSKQIRNAVQGTANRGRWFMLHKSMKIVFEGIKSTGEQHRHSAVIQPEKCKQDVNTLLTCHHCMFNWATRKNGSSDAARMRRR